MDQIFERDQSAYADGFVEGLYVHRRNGHVDLPVRVFFGPPRDLAGGHLERSHRWQVSCAGSVLGDEREPVGMARLVDIWPRCLGLPIDDDEYRYLLERIRHARQHSPTDPFGNVRGRIDPLTAKVPF